LITRELGSGSPQGFAIRDEKKIDFSHPFEMTARRNWQGASHPSIVRPFDYAQGSLLRANCFEY